MAKSRDLKQVCAMSFSTVIFNINISYNCAKGKTNLGSLLSKSKYLACQHEPNSKVSM